MTNKQPRYTLKQQVDLNLRLGPPEKRRSIRRRAHVPADVIAHHLGVTRQCVLAWEKGLRNPSGRNLAAYVEVLDLLDDLFGGAA